MNGTEGLWLARRWRHLRRLPGGLAFRWLLWLVLTVVGCCVNLFWSRARELSHVIEYLGLAGVSLLASAGLWLLAFNVPCAALLWWTAGRPPGRASAVLVALNRQIGHAEAFFTWLTIACVLMPWLALQISLAAYVTLLGSAVLNELARALPSLGGDLRWRRRPFVYVLAIAGVAVLVGVAPAQAEALRALVVTVVLGSLIRFAAWRRQRKNPSPDARQTTTSDARTLGVDVALIFAFLAGAIGVPWYKIYVGRDARQGDGTSLAPAACLTAPHQPPAISLFLVADSQFHEIGGRRSGGHLDLVDAVVPVAVRPVELDLLSGVTLDHFGRMFAGLRASRPGLRWAHLGDLGDLSCRGELARVQSFIDRFGRTQLAGIAPGNHDNTFMGNFAWHPQWDDACVSGRLEKPASDELVGRLMQGTSSQLGQLRWRSVLGERRSASPMLAQLGTLNGRPLLGAFLDTSERSSWTVGIAGIEGSVSDVQVAWFRERLAAHPRPYVIFFGHHPFAELNWQSTQRVRALLAAPGIETLALVSAHTHHSARRSALPVEEVIVGSTTDAPQEAMLLDVGEEGGRPWLRFRTLQSVRRASCPASPLPWLGADVCREKLRELARQPACAHLFDPEWPTGVSSRHEHSPAEVRTEQAERARQLLACVCHGDTCRPGDPLSDDWVFGMLEKRAESDGGLLACLSWMTSVREERPELTPLAAMERAFDPDTVPAEREVCLPATACRR